MSLKINIRSQELNFTASFIVGSICALCVAHTYLSVLYIQCIQINTVMSQSIRVFNFSNHLADLE
jgi:hypothetical protein